MVTNNIWKKNLFILSIAVFIAGIAFSEIIPFLPLYVASLGDFSHQELNFWSGFIYSGMFIISAITSPWWGKLADKKGRKLMILRASLGMAIAIGAMGLVTNVYQLLALRCLQGLFAGFVSNSNALIATQTPKEKAGQAMGTMASSVTAGTLLGPLIGGFLASIFSYRITFFITGFLLFITFVMSLFWVKEDNFVVKNTKEIGKTKDVIKQFKSPNLIFGLLITTMIIQAANNSINPIVSLFVKQLLHGNGNVVLISGIIAALPGIATFAVASKFGALGDKIGTHKIIVAGFIGASLLFFATAFVQNTIELGILRFLVGFSDACLFPQVQTMLSKNSPASVTGRVFSWNQSAMYIGNIAGPLIGTTISGLSTYNMVFIITTFLVLFNFLLFKLNVINNLSATKD